MPSFPIFNHLEEKEIELYRLEIKPILPQNIIDFHAHVCLPGNLREITEKRKRENIGLGIINSLQAEMILQIYGELFKERNVECVVCPFPFRECKPEEANKYVSNVSKKHSRITGFCLVDPASTYDEMQHLVVDEGFMGLKPYPDRVIGKAWNDINIKDYVTSDMLKIAEDYCLPVFIHVPKDTRLASPETIKEIRKISEQFPSISIVLAHVGRLHCPPLIKKGIQGVMDMPNVFFESSLITNPRVFEFAFEKVGPERLVFGTDLPFTLVRNRVMCMEGKPVWAVKNKFPWVKEEHRILFKDVIKTVTLMVYENILALKRAVQAVGLNKKDVTKIFHDNAREMLDRVTNVLH